MSDSIKIISFYKFLDFSPEDIARVKTGLSTIATDIDGKAGYELAARGLTILGTEGINATYSVATTWADELQERLMDLLGTRELFFKVSDGEKHAFHDFKIKVRDEIVTLDRPDLVPSGARRHLSPEEWHQVMKNENPIVIDTRNAYEYDIGRFKGAIDPRIEEFNEFPQWVRQADLPKDKKVLIYCTGGIRCEKAILEMEEQGYSNVYQLDGGILNYLEKYKDQQKESCYEGECFVFDYRIAVDHNLRPSNKYRLCPHCGQPAQTQINCIQCGVEEVVCDACLAKGAQETGQPERSQYHTCSKNCAHHFRMGHRVYSYP